jgi:hypothetical protein
MTGLNLINALIGHVDLFARPAIRLESMPSAEITSYRPTSRYLSACPDLDYFRLADNLSGTLVIISQKPVSGEPPVRRPAARMKRLFCGVVAAPKSYRARGGIDLCCDFNEVAFRVAHHRFVVSVSSYRRASSYGHSGCAHGSY